MLDLYTWNTPNGHKGRIAVEVMELPYNLHAVNLQAKENVGDEYSAIKRQPAHPHIGGRRWSRRGASSSSLSKSSSSP